MSKAPIRIAVTGAAGQIGYSLVFRLASGEVFGPDQPVVLQFLELPQSLKAAEGTAMELYDCGFSTLADVRISDKAEEAFDGVHWALLVGSKPRGPGMERADLIKENGPIFVAQGRALEKADASVRVAVVGNPCNTNALIAQKNCQAVPAERFTAMTLLDENRAKAQLAQKSGQGVGAVSRLAIWGNHSTTMYPDFERALIGSDEVPVAIKDEQWLRGEFLSKVQKRGAEIIQARGKSSAASAASACIDHVKRFSEKTPEGEWFSAAVTSDGNPYGIPDGLIYSFPVASDGQGGYSIVEGVPVSDFMRQKIDASAEELLQERAVVADLLS